MSESDQDLEVRICGAKTTVPLIKISLKSPVILWGGDSSDEEEDEDIFVNPQPHTTRTCPREPPPSIPTEETVCENSVFEQVTEHRNATHMSRPVPIGDCAFSFHVGENPVKCPFPKSHPLYSVDPHPVLMPIGVAVCFCPFCGVNGILESDPIPTGDNGESYCICPWCPTLLPHRTLSTVPK